MPLKRLFLTLGDAGRRQVACCYRTATPGYGGPLTVGMAYRSAIRRSSVRERRALAMGTYPLQP